jgi:hypothetical protein
MSAGAWGVVAVMVLGLGGLDFVLFAMVRTILKNRSTDRPVWREFGLALALMPGGDGGWQLPEVPETASCTRPGGRRLPRQSASSPRIVAKTQIVGRDRGSNPVEVRGVRAGRGWGYPEPTSAGSGMGGIDPPP